MLLALIFFGHPHFAHLAISMHFQHEWHRSKKQEGRGWGGGWPQKWHSLEMVEDFKTVRHVGGMKGWYWQRCTLDTGQAAPNSQKNPQITSYLTKLVKGGGVTNSLTGDTCREKNSSGAIKFAIPHRRTKIEQLKSRDRVPDNVASWTGNVFEFSSLLWNNSALNSFAPGGNHFKQWRHAENWIILPTEDKRELNCEICKYIRQLFLCQKFFGFPKGEWQSCHN